jgi:hypothetical protein
MFYACKTEKDDGMIKDGDGYTWFHLVSGLFPTLSCPNIE